jgi:mRNA interferase HicA
VTYRDAARKLRQLRCQELRRRSGESHRKWHNPVTGGVTVLPDWGSKDLKLGTVRAAVRDLGIEWEQFTRA